MRELAVAFGEAGRMVGVLTLPDAPTRLPHVLLLNAGFVHRVGPGRLGVDLARNLAELGFPALRFDFSGIGDSAARVPPLDTIACGVADARLAMDFLATEHGAERFVLLGLCSGARHAHYIGLADPRVTGLILLDGAVYPTSRSQAIRARAYLRRPGALLAALGRRGRRLVGLREAPKPVDEVDAFFPNDPSRAQMASDLARFIERQVAMLCICSGEWRTYLYEGQLRDAFSELALAPLLTERLIDTADHLYFTRPERAELLRTLNGWMKQRYLA